jgi:hypothetical protein
MRGRDYRRTVASDKKNRRIKILMDYNHMSRIGSIECNFVNGVWKPTGTHIKYPKNSKMQKYLKKQSRRKVRRSEPYPKGNSYRKCMEYHWNFWY